MDFVTYSGIIAVICFLMFEYIGLIEKGDILYKMESGLIALLFLILFLGMFRHLLISKNSFIYKFLWSLLFIFLSIIGSYIYYIFVFQKSKENQ